ncbi:hypothetical protein [Brucella pituitosa]|uniref:Uncharacterized protein n=1 Tax=Brucella pituitosa TaxID=571256 RepID=A0ABS3JU37_9HYPH|nr:hypothetical protein [Brucella pituitosa]MBO1038191.1 hypothetical protein [Brucella pituitosa]
MFEVGKTYRIYEFEQGGLGYHSSTVIAWEAPLLKVSHPGKEYVIYNTSSSSFHRAELDGSPHPKFDVEEFLNLPNDR